MKKRKLKKEELEKMADLNLDKVLDELSKIDSREGIKTIAALLLNELMKKEREIYLRESCILIGRMQKIKSGINC